MKANSTKYGWDYPSAQPDNTNFLITGANVVNKKVSQEYCYVDAEHIAINCLENAIGHIGEK
jgi:hypothetical protein